MRRIICLIMIIGFIMSFNIPVNAKDLAGRVGAGVNVSGAIPEDNDGDTTVYVGGNVNYGITNYLAVGVESGYMSFDIKQDDIDLGDLKGVPILGDIILRIPTGEKSRFNPYAVLGLGVVVWDFEESSTLKDNDISIKVDTSFAMKFAGGLDFFLTDNVALNFEGGYVWSDSDATADVSGTIITEESVKTDYWQIGAGIKYYF